MAGVRNELPDPHLRCLPGSERLGDVVKHPVHRGADLTDLGPRVGLGRRNALAQIDVAAFERQFRNTGCGLRHPS